MKDMKRYAKASGRRRSGTRRARRQRQLICILACLILCLVAGYLGYRHIAKTEKPTVILPTPTPSIAVRKMDTASVEAALPYGLYTESYTSSLSEDDLWMEDFVDNRTPVDVKGVYLTAEVLNKKFDEVAALLDETEVNAVVFDIKNDKGYLTVKMDSPLLKEKGETLLFMSNLPALITKLKAHNIYCIARIVCFRDNYTPVKSPDYAVHMKTGELLKDRDGFYWLNPFKEEVWEFLTEIGREAARAGFDEVNFDYCRFGTDSKLKEADFGKELTAENKEAAITGFVKYACENLKPMGVYVSVDVFGAAVSSANDAAAIGQNYAEMAKYLDYICPMVYPSHYGKGYFNLDIPDKHPYELIYNAMLDSKKALASNKAKGRCADVRPWLQAFTATWVSGHITYGAKEVKDQINATYDAGYTGWLLWNPSPNTVYSGFRDGLEPESK